MNDVKGETGGTAVEKQSQPVSAVGIPEEKKVSETLNTCKAEDIPEDSEDKEEELRVVLLRKLREKVKSYEECRAARWRDRQDMYNIYDLINYSNYRGAISVLTEIVDETNLFLGYSNGETNTLRYYQKIVNEITEERNRMYKGMINSDDYLKKRPIEEGMTRIIKEEEHTSTITTLEPNERSELLELLKSAISLIQGDAETTAKSMGSQERKKKAQGKGNPNYNTAVDTEKLIEEYEVNGCHLTKEICERYKADYGITMQGLRNRLMKAGKWKGRN